MKPTPHMLTVHCCVRHSAAVDLPGMGPAQGQLGRNLLQEPPDTPHLPYLVPCCCSPAGPDLAQLREVAGLMQPELIKSVPKEFDPRYATQCWTEDDNSTTHCLPGFYILGDAYSGAGQLWSLLGQHPEVPKVRQGRGRPGTGETGRAGQGGAVQARAGQGQGQVRTWPPSTCTAGQAGPRQGSAGQGLLPAAVSAVQAVPVSFNEAACCARQQGGSCVLQGHT
jgi:hypothetical protein